MGRKGRFGAHVTIASITLLSAAAFGVLSAGRVPRVEAQGATSSMESRLNQVIAALKGGKTPAMEDAINDGMEILYGGLRPLPSKGDAMEQTQDAHAKVSQFELRLADALEDASKKENAPPGTLDLKLFIEQMNEVAQAVGQFTSQCGLNDDTGTGQCAELQPRLNENGEEVSPGAGEEITPGYTVKLRGPAIPRWTFGWGETVVSTPAIADGECTAVVKETRGLMVRLRFERITVVSDPWVSTFGVPRGTAVPIWTLSWIPSQYVKEINICNDGGVIEKEVTQRVVQDPALSYFWRMYPKDP